MWTICVNCREGYKALRLSSKFCKAKCRVAYNRNKKRNEENEARAAIGLPPKGKPRKITITVRQIEQVIGELSDKSKLREADGVREFAKAIGVEIDEDWVRRDIRRRYKWRSSKRQAIGRKRNKSAQAIS